MRSVASFAIELQSVTIEFDGIPFLSGIDLSIPQGENFVLIGSSSEGKSVLLKLMSGVIEPTSGCVLVEGEDIWAAPRRRRQQIVKKMGMLFQKNALFDSLTCSENIAFPMREVLEIDSESISKSVAFYLEAVGLSDAHDLFPDEISGGMQKRLGIARALAMDPEIIFYDDPTAGLDPITSRVIVDLILRLQKEKSSTVIAVTSDMNRAYQMADRIGMVVDRGLIVTGSPEQTRQHSDPRVCQFTQVNLRGH